MCPIPDSHFFQQMLNFTEINPHLGFTVIESITNHTWYLTEQWVIASLADEDCPAEERKAVATALSQTPRPESFPPGKPKLPKDFWPESGDMPSLSQFVGPKSWLLPHILKLTDENMEWLHLEVHQWSLMSGYKKFSSFVHGLVVVNDPAERGVKLIQDFIDTSQDEELRQWQILSESDQRKKYSKNMRKQDMKKLKAS